VEHSALPDGNTTLSFTVTPPLLLLLLLLLAPVAAVLVADVLVAVRVVLPA